MTCRAIPMVKNPNLLFFFARGLSDFLGAPSHIPKIEFNVAALNSQNNNARTADVALKPVCLMFRRVFLQLIPHPPGILTEVLVTMWMILQPFDGTTPGRFAKRTVATLLLSSRQQRTTLFGNLYPSRKQLQFGVLGLDFTEGMTPTSTGWMALHYLRASLPYGDQGNRIIS